MDRKRVWRRTIVLELEIPDPEDSWAQRSRISFASAEDLGNDDVVPCNSVKVDTAEEALNALTGDLVQYLVTQMPEWDRHIKASAEARNLDLSPPRRARVLYKGEHWFYGGPDNDALTRHRIYREGGTEKIVFNGEFEIVTEGEDDES